MTKVSNMEDHLPKLTLKHGPETAPSDFVPTSIILPLSNDRRQMAFDALKILNQPTDIERAIQEIAELLKERTGIEAIGIRLEEDLDFPYFYTLGFPESFLSAEQFLCSRNSQGQIVKDKSGQPLLECMCGNVISGRTNSKLPFFTDGGSFWSNSTTKLLTSTSAEERQAKTINRCNQDGYESVALIPLKSTHKTIGLLQFNDHRQNMFGSGIIQYLEGIASIIGIALARKVSDKNLIRLHEKQSQDQTNQEARNLVMQELINNIDREKRQIALQIQSNIDRIALPIIEILEEKCGPSEKHYISLIKNCLEDITSPFISRLERQSSRLTPRELEISNMIKNGFTTKKIARILDISVHTVHNQRKAIRKKLMLNGQKLNLATHLQSLQTKHRT